MIENIEHENNQNNQTDLYNRLLARIGTNELKRILAEEFNIQ